MVPVSRLPIVAVIGSSSELHEERAAAIGRWLATQDVHLLTGAGGEVMQAVSRAFFQSPGRKGLVIGIVPAAKSAPDVPKKGYPNKWVEIPIRTHLPLSGEQGAESLSRNHIVVLTSAVIVALPGGAGTASEVRLAMRYGRPVIAYLGSRDEIEGLPADVTVESDLEQVRAFVSKELAKIC